MSNVTLIKLGRNSIVCYYLHYMWWRISMPNLNFTNSFWVFGILSTIRNLHDFCKLAKTKESAKFKIFSELRNNERICKILNILRTQKLFEIQPSVWHVWLYWPLARNMNATRFSYFGWFEMKYPTVRDILAIIFYMLFITWIIVAETVIKSYLHWERWKDKSARQWQLCTRPLWVCETVMTTCMDCWWLCETNRGFNTVSLTAGKDNCCLHNISLWNSQDHTYVIVSIMWLWMTPVSRSNKSLWVCDTVVNTSMQCLWLYKTWMNCEQPSHCGREDHWFYAQCESVRHTWWCE